MIPHKFLTFACTGQSGHTILAAIIDAHPNAMISEELRVMRKMAKGRYSSPKELFERVMLDSKNRVNGKNTYRRKIGTIDSQYQGAFSRNLILLGDKCGWDSIGKYTERGVKNRTLLEFQDNIKIPLLVIHALRNPFDLISNWVRGRKSSLSSQIEYFESTVEATQRIYYDSDFPRDQIMQVRNEDLCAAPDVIIKDICIFLGLDPEKDFIGDCASIVFSKPNYRKGEVSWDDESIKKVEELVTKYKFLNGYCF